MPAFSNALSLVLALLASTSSAACKVFNDVLGELIFLIDMVGLDVLMWIPPYLSISHRPAMSTTIYTSRPGDWIRVSPGPWVYPVV